MRAYHTSRQRNRRSLIPLIVVSAVLAIAGIFALQKADNVEIVYDAETREKEAAALSDTVDVGGIVCTPKRNIRSYLIMGIDNTAS